MQIKKIKRVFLKKTSLFFVLFLGYIILNGILNKTHVIFQNLYSEFGVIYSTVFIFMNFIFVPGLVSFTLIFSFKKFEDLRTVTKAKGAFSFVGIFGTLLGGACPSCFVGLFPAFVGLFGSSLTLNNLPFNGLEIQFISSAILILSLHYMTRPTVCLVKN